MGPWILNGNVRYRARNQRIDMVIGCSRPQIARQIWDRPPRRIVSAATRGTVERKRRCGSQQESQGRYVSIDVIDAARNDGCDGGCDRRLRPPLAGSSVKGTRKPLKTRPTCISNFANERSRSFRLLVAVRLEMMVSSQRLPLDAADIRESPTASRRMCSHAPSCTVARMKATVVFFATELRRQRAQVWPAICRIRTRGTTLCCFPKLPSPP